MTKFDEFARTHARPALCWCPVPAADDIRSQTGGLPLWPEGLDWPREGETPAIFIAQIDLAELPWRPQDWPEAGMLYLFQNNWIDGAPDTPTDKPFVYYAAPGHALERTAPPEPLTDGTAFNYEGGGYVSYGKLQEPALDREWLPEAGLRFARFDDLPTAWSDDVTPAEDDASAWETIRAELLRRITEAKEALPDIHVMVGETPEEADRRIHGGAALTDPEGARTKAFANTGGYTEVPELDPRYADWPLTGAVLYYHAMMVAHGRAQASKNLPERSDVHRIRTEAESWARYGLERAMRPLTEEERGGYLDWCRLTASQAMSQLVKRRDAIEAQRAAQEKSEEDTGLLARLLESVWKDADTDPAAAAALQKATEAEMQELTKLAQSLLQLSDAHEYGLRVQSAETMAALPDHALNTFLRQTVTGQLFGWGTEIQDEVQRHKDLVMLAEINGNRDLSYGSGTFKIWLTGPLVPDAWQKVVIEFAVS